MVFICIQIVIKRSSHLFLSLDQCGSDKFINALLGKRAAVNMTCIKIKEDANAIRCEHSIRGSGKMNAGLTFCRGEAAFETNVSVPV